MNASAMFNRRVYLQVLDLIKRLLYDLQRLPETGEAIDTEVARVCKLLELATQQPKTEQENDAPICQVHDVPMKLVQGKKGPFWSCHMWDPKKGYCTYRPPNA